MLIWKIAIEKTFKKLKLVSKNFEIGVVVQSFCFGLILSPPLALIAKNGYFEWNMSPWKLLSPFDKQYMSERLYQCGEMAEYQQRVDNTDGVEWKRLSLPNTPFPFQFYD
jgi:hypothetical protein